jgi:hypothetical protein
MDGNPLSSTVTMGYPRLMAAFIISCSLLEIWEETRIAPEAAAD